MADIAGPPDRGSAELNRRGRIDALYCVVFACGAFLLSSCFDAFERLHQFTADHDNWQLDEIVVAGFVTALALAAFAVRRWQDARAELAARIALEQVLVRAKVDAENAARARGQFVAKMSHELRTPLNGVLGLSEILLSTDLEPNQREMTQMLRGSAEWLLTIINDILDFAKIEAGKLRFIDIDFDLEELIGTTLKTMAVQAHRKNLELAWSVDSSSPTILRGDPSRLRQIIVNLVGNAIKFTDTGEVVLEAFVESGAQADCCLHISVRDTGRGIPPDKQAVIFEAFEQLDASTTREHGGTGLGLAITSQLVRHMGGTISVDSVPGLGSTFRFTAEVGLGTTDVEPVMQTQSLAGRTVLIVDDNATNRFILERTVTEWRMRCVCVDGGPSALQAVADLSAKGGAFDLILLDCRMPGMDGFEIAERLRASVVLQGAVIMMLTSDERPGDAERSRQLGVSKWLTKPLTQAELLRAVLAALDSGTPDDAQTHPPPHVTAGRSLRVLIADDNKINQIVTARMLRQVGHIPVVVDNGAEAVSKWQSEHFDAILMDVQMPVMGGWAATESIRRMEQETGCHTPIIALTAAALRGDDEKCLSAGMDAFLSKPVRRDQLLHTLDLLCIAHQVETLNHGPPPA